MAVGTPKKKHKKAFPSFSTLWDAYPPTQQLADGSIINTYPCDEGSTDPITNEFTRRYANQCAIRLSSCLIKSGVSLATYTDPKCNHGFARGAESLATWIWRNFRRPIIIKDARELSNFSSSDYYKKSGIIFFKDFYPIGNQTSERYSGDHIDLLFNETTASYHGNYVGDPDVKQIWFWEID